MCCPLTGVKVVPAVDGSIQPLGFFRGRQVVILNPHDSVVLESGTNQTAAFFLRALLSDYRDCVIAVVCVLREQKKVRQSLIKGTVEG